MGNLVRPQENHWFVFLINLVGTRSDLSKCSFSCFAAAESIPGVYSRPITRAQKLENLQLCMSFMGNRGIILKGIYVGGGEYNNHLSLCPSCVVVLTMFWVGVFNQDLNGPLLDLRLTDFVPLVKLNV